MHIGPYVAKEINKCLHPWGSRPEAGANEPENHCDRAPGRAFGLLKLSDEVLAWLSLSRAEFTGVFCCGQLQNVFMVHALKRISYATCNPSMSQFSFLARNSKSPPGVQCCHVFSTGTPQEVVIILLVCSCLCYGC